MDVSDEGVGPDWIERTTTRLLGVAGPAGTSKVRGWNTLVY